MAQIKSIRIQTQELFSTPAHLPLIQRHMYEQLSSTQINKLDQQTQNGVQPRVTEQDTYTLSTSILRDSPYARHDR